MIVSDLDGVWTDGRIIYTGDARETKEFNVRDGLGVKLAQSAGIMIAVLTSRHSKAVERRCRELGISGLVQGASDKAIELERMVEACGLTPEQVLYVGDDLPDIAPMRIAGLAAAPADAVAEVLAIADWKLERSGGTGAVRELVERLLRERGEWESVLEGFDAKAIDAAGS
jgi:3-deoxy-D-manno-octulosonate 8-phosphate phosphatase (KDO 8-P phosphatase)